MATVSTVAFFNFKTITMSLLDDILGFDSKEIIHLTNFMGQKIREQQVGDYIIWADFFSEYAGKIVSMDDEIYAIDNKDRKWLVDKSDIKFTITEKAYNQYIQKKRNRF